MPSIKGRTDPSKKMRQSLTARPNWTILVYLAGDNNLSEECVYALKEMKKVGTGQGEVPDFNVVVDFDPPGRGNPTRRFQIRKRGDDGSIECDELFNKRRFESDSGSPASLLRFLCESINAAPAEHYMVVLAGHGAGFFHGVFLQDETRPFSTIPNSFPINRLKRVFNDPKLKRALHGRKIDILGFDACMMSMLEVCYELRDINTLDLVVGSGGFTLNSGWPFDRILNTLRRHPDIPATALARAIVEQYTRFYHDYFLGGLSVDIAALKLSRIEALKKNVDRLACALISDLNEDSVKPCEDDTVSENSGASQTIARLKDRKEWYCETGRPFQDTLLLTHWASQSYNGERCVDLYDFCDLLQKRWIKNKADNDSVWMCCERVKREIRDRLVIKSCFSGAAFQYANGVSIYFPWARFDFDVTYKRLDFGKSKKSEWPKFLAKYLRTTQRRPLDVDLELKEGEHRATPPADRGLGGKVFSMRNPPPIFLPSACVKKVVQ